MWKNKVLAIAFGSAVALGAFAVVYLGRGDEHPARAGQSGEPSDGAPTAAAGETPDTSQPFWHMPYVEADAAREPFAGDLNGFVIDPDPARSGRTGFDVCPDVGLGPPPPGSELSFATAPGPLQIDPRALPEGIAPSNLPEVFLCRGEVAEIGWTFSVRAGTADANEGGSGLYIRRVKGNEVITYGAPSERWVEASVHGLPVIVSKPIITVGAKQFGGCFLAAYNPETDVLTTVSGLAANEGLCLRVAEEVQL